MNRYPHLQPQSARSHGPSYLLPVPANFVLLACSGGLPQVAVMHTGAAGILELYRQAAEQAAAELRRGRIVRNRDTYCWN